MNRSQLLIGTTQANFWDRGRPARNERAARTRLLATTSTLPISISPGIPNTAQLESSLYVTD
jgi:hypothetical protein